MRYEPLEEAGTLEVVLQGNPPDLDAFGIAQTHLQEIVDRVAYWVAVEGGLLPPTRTQLPHLRRLGRAFRLGEPGHLVKGRVLGASSGPLVHEIGFVLAAVVADPDMRAILQNLAANVVWAIGRSGLRGIRRNSNLEPPPRAPRLERADPADIGPNLRTVILALAESGQTSEIRIRSKRGGRVEHEVLISLEGNQ